MKGISMATRMEGLDVKEGEVLSRFMASIFALRESEMRRQLCGPNRFGTEKGPILIPCCLGIPSSRLFFLLRLVLTFEIRPHCPLKK